jgi:hypothetical protein
MFMELLRQASQQVDDTEYQHGQRTYVAEKMQKALGAGSLTPSQQAFSGQLQRVLRGEPLTPGMHMNPGVRRGGFRIKIDGRDDK